MAHYKGLLQHCVARKTKKTNADYFQNVNFREMAMQCASKHKFPVPLQKLYIVVERAVGNFRFSQHYLFLNNIPEFQISRNTRIIPRNPSNTPIIIDKSDFVMFYLNKSKAQTQDLSLNRYFPK